MSEKVTIKVERKKLHLPTIALRGLVVFPNNLVHFEVGREKSIAAVEWAMANNSNVFLVAQKSMDTTEPQQADLFSYGVVAEVKQVLRVSGDLVKVLVEGKYRAKLSALDASGDFLLSEVRPAPVRAGKADDAVETEALLRALKAGFDEYLGMNPRAAHLKVDEIVGEHHQPAQGDGGQMQLFALHLDGNFFTHCANTSRLPRTFPRRQRCMQEILSLK